MQVSVTSEPDVIPPMSVFVDNSIPPSGVVSPSNRSFLGVPHQAPVSTGRKASIGQESRQSPSHERPDHSPKGSRVARQQQQQAQSLQSVASANAEVVTLKATVALMSKAVQSQKAYIHEVCEERDVAVDHWRLLADENQQLREQVSRLMVTLSSTQVGSRSMFELLTHKGLLDMSLLQRNKHTPPPPPPTQSKSNPSQRLSPSSTTNNAVGMEQNDDARRNHLSQFDVHNVVAGPSVVTTYNWDAIVNDTPSRSRTQGGPHAAAEEVGLWTPNKWADIEVDETVTNSKGNVTKTNGGSSLAARHKGKGLIGHADRTSQVLAAVVIRDSFIKDTQRRLNQYSCSSTVIRRRCKVERWDDDVGRWRQRILTIMPPGIIVDEGSGVPTTGFGSSSKRALEGHSTIQMGRFAAVEPSSTTRLHLLLSTFTEDLITWSASSTELRRVLTQALPTALVDKLSQDGSTHQSALDAARQFLKAHCTIKVEVHQGIEESLRSALGAEEDTTKGERPLTAHFYLRCTLNFFDDVGLSSEDGIDADDTAAATGDEKGRSHDIIEQFRTICSTDAVRWVRALQACLKQNRFQSKLGPRQ